jgi:hypothetical protein
VDVAQHDAAHLAGELGSLGTDVQTHVHRVPAVAAAVLAAGVPRGGGAKITG